MSNAYTNLPMIREKTIDSSPSNCFISSESNKRKFNES